MADGIPDRIGRYEIRSRLGAGGMGRVYLARDTLLRRDVALKFPLDSGGPETVSTLLHEARSASVLNHPGICQVYDAGESEAGPWIAMELVRGEALDTRIAPGGLPFDTTLALALDILTALSHAHQRGIIHRDLKPSNIACDADGGVKVLDFGLARVAASHAHDTTTLTAGYADDETIGGTPAYMAPEVIRGQPADARSDLWSFGVMLYEMAAGARPFDGRTPLERISSILTDSPAPLPASLPPSFAAIVHRLLEKSPERRYQSAAEVIAALQVLRQPSTALLPASDTSRSRNRRVTWVAMSLAVGALGFTAAWFGSRNEALALTNIQPLSAPDAPQSQPTISPDGSQLAFVSPDAKKIPQVWVRTIGEPAGVQLTFGSTPASHPRWHPNGGSIVYALRDSGIWTISPLGGAPRRIRAEGANPNLSRDGRWLTWEQDGDIWFAEADGSAARAVGVPETYYTVPRLPSLSPDGSQIVYFQAALGPHGDFWRISSSGGKPERLTFDLRPGGASTWMPDGERIVIASGRAGTMSLWQLPAEGGEPEPLTTGAGEDNLPAISADGSRIAFTNVRNSWELRVRDETGTERILLQRPTEVLFPRFSPDGSRIAYFGSVGSAVAISTVARDGTDERQLTGGRELNHMPRWSADGQSVLFYQSSPKVGVRRVPDLGGSQSDVLPFEWERQNALEVSSGGDRMVYTLLDSNLANEVTVVRDLETGEEHPLEKPHLHFARFSRDGTRIAGSRHDGHIVVCRVADLGCDAVAETDWRTTVAWSGDDSYVYFLRGADRTSLQQVWSVNLKNGDERRHGGIGPFRGIDRFFDVSPSGEIVWAPYRSGRSELWTATIR